MCVAVHVCIQQGIYAYLAQWVIIVHAHLYTSMSACIIGLLIKQMLGYDTNMYMNECLGIEVYAQKCKCKVCETVSTCCMCDIFLTVLCICTL